MKQYWYTFMSLSAMPADNAFYVRHTKPKPSVSTTIFSFLHRQYIAISHPQYDIFLFLLIPSYSPSHSFRDKVNTTFLFLFIKETKYTIQLV